MATHWPITITLICVFDQSLALPVSSVRFWTPAVFTFAREDHRPNCMIFKDQREFYSRNVKFIWNGRVGRDERSELQKLAKQHGIKATWRYVYHLTRFLKWVGPTWLYLRMLSLLVLYCFKKKCSCIAVGFYNTQANLAK